MRVRVLLVDDHEVLLEGLSALLAREDGIEVAGSARNGSEAVELAAELGPDVVIMDVLRPGTNGIEATRRILAKSPGTKVLCLSMHAEKEFVTAAFDAGASGYVLKDESLHTVLEAVDALVAGKCYLCEGISATVLQVIRSSQESGAGDRLTNRERQVLRLLAEGRSTRETAKELDLSPKTIGAHRDHIKEKLGIKSIAGLTKYAIRHGLTTTERNPGR